MSAASVEVLRLGRERARAGRWRGEEQVALLTPVPSAPAPSVEFLAHCMSVLSAQGYTRVVTGALTPSEQAGFIAAGFDVAARLHLLGIDLTRRPEAPAPGPERISRGCRRDVAAVLEIDGAAFDGFWRFDESSLADALAATPRTRWRVARAGGTVCGYAISGRAGRRGFVQRLAVAPGHQGHGLGRRLLFDGLGWMYRHGVSRAVVNTQVGNERALALYLSAGFEEDPSGLSVLAAGLA